MNPVDQLAAVKSKGRRMPAIWPDAVTGEVHVHERPSRPCPGCGEVTGEAESITKLFSSWWHHECAKAYLRTEGQDEAWLVLGRQLADRPSAFKASQIKAIAEQLVRIASQRIEPKRSEPAKWHLR